MITRSKADGWRVVSGVLAAACVLLVLLLAGSVSRLHATERRVLHALDGCPLSREDLEHS